MSDGAPKSSYELAMERLRAKDKEQGVEERALTDEQKAEIADIKRTYEARLAEREILHKSERAKARDADGLAQLEEEYHRDRDRLNGERERKLESVRSR